MELWSRGVALFLLMYASSMHASECPGQCPCENCSFSVTDYRLCPVRFTSMVKAVSVFDCVCVPGYKGDITSDCVPCSDSEYCPLNSTRPVECPEGFECNVSTAIPLPGRWNWNHSKFELCPGGYVCSRDGVSEPVLCDAGSYCPPGSDFQRQCPAGFYCSNGTDTPVNCSSGFYCVAGCVNMTVCPAGSYCEEGASEPTICPPGSFCSEGVAYGSVCLAGKFCAEGVSSGTVCPVGFYCIAGSSEPTSCSNGILCVEGSSADTVPCPGGITCIGADIELCPAGQFCVEGSSAGVVCPQGFFCAIGVNQPKPCGPGILCNEGSADDLNPCPPGMECMNGTATICPATLFCPMGSYAGVLCAAGGYCPVGVAAPLPCLDGQVCVEGSSVPEQCKAGFYCPARTSIAYPCPENSYCADSVGVFAPCPDGALCPATTVQPCYGIPALARNLTRLCEWNCTTGYTINADATDCIAQNGTSFATLLDFNINDTMINRVFLKNLTQQVEEQGGCGKSSECKALVLSITKSDGTTVYCDHGKCPGYDEDGNDTGNATAVVPVTTPTPSPSETFDEMSTPADEVDFVTPSPGNRRLLQTAPVPKVSIGLISVTPVSANVTFKVTIGSVVLSYSVSFNVAVNNTLLGDTKALVLMVNLIIVMPPPGTPEPQVVVITTEQTSLLVYGLVALATGVCVLATLALIIMCRPCVKRWCGGKEEIVSKTAEVDKVDQVQVNVGTEGNKPLETNFTWPRIDTSNHMKMV